MRKALCSIIIPLSLPKKTTDSRTFYYMEFLHAALVDFPCGVLMDFLPMGWPGVYHVAMQECLEAGNLSSGCLVS